MRLPGINLILKPDRMAELIDGVDFAPDTSLDQVPYPAQVAIEKIYSMAPNRQPSATVDGRAPSAGRRYQAADVAVIKFARREIEPVKREGGGRIVIQS